MPEEKKEEDEEEEEEEDEFDGRATVFERRLTLATEEMMQQTHLAFPSNGNSNDFSGEAETTTTTTTTTTTATEEEEEEKEEEEKKRRRERKEIVEKWILRDARKENEEARQKGLLTTTTEKETTLALYKENATVADAFLLGAGKLTSTLIEAYEESLDNDSPSSCTLAEFICDALVRSDDDGASGGGNNTKKKKDKRSSTNKSSSSSIRSSAKSSTYRAFLEVLLLIAESEELKDTQLRLLPFRFIEDVFAQSSVEDCSDIVSKYLFSENFIPKGNQGYEDGDYYPHDIDGIKYPEEKTGVKRKKSKTKLIQRDVYDRLIAIMDIKKEFDENGLRKMKSASEIYSQTGPEKYDCGEECQVIMLKSFDELLNRSSQILHAEFRGKVMLMSNGIQDFAEGAHLAAGIDFIAENECNQAAKELEAKNDDNNGKQSKKSAKTNNKKNPADGDKKNEEEKEQKLNEIVLDDLKTVEKVFREANEDFDDEVDAVISPQLYFAFWEAMKLFGEPLIACKLHISSVDDFQSKVVENLNIVLEKIKTISPFRKQMLRAELLEQLALTGTLRISSARAFPFQMRDGFFLRNFLAQAAMFLHFVIFHFDNENSPLEKEHAKEAAAREARIAKMYEEQTKGRVIIDGIQEAEDRMKEEAKAMGIKLKKTDKKSEGDAMDVDKENGDDDRPRRRENVPKFGFSEEQMTMWRETIVPVARECFEELLNIVEKTDACPEHGKHLRIFLIATLYSTEHYDTWVNMGCPSFEREEIDVVAEQKEYERKEKEKEDAEKAKYPEGYIRFENNPEMERVWNVYPSYEAAMTDPERNKYSKPEFMKEFLQVVYDEMDPEAQIEEEYKTKNDTVYRWKAFRLIRQWNFAAFRNMKNNDLETIVPEILGLDPPKGWKPHNPVDFRDVPIEMPDIVDGKKVDKSLHRELTDEEIDKIIDETHAKLMLEKKEKEKLEEEKKAVDELAAKKKTAEQQPAARKRSPQRSTLPSDRGGRGRAQEGRGQQGGRGSKGTQQHQRQPQQNKMGKFDGSGRGGGRTQTQQQPDQRMGRDSQQQMHQQQQHQQRSASRDRFHSSRGPVQGGRGGRLNNQSQQQPQQHHQAGRGQQGGRGGRGGPGSGGRGRGPPQTKRARR